MIRCGFVGHQVADPQALVPGAGVVPMRLLRIARLVEKAVVGRDHSSLGAVHENRHPTGLFFQAIPERADQIGAEEARVGAEHLRMNRVVDERRDRLSGGGLRPDDAHPLVIERGGVIVVRDFPPGLVGGDLDPAGLQTVDRLVEGRRRFVADEVHVFEVAGVPAAPVGKTVAVRSAVRVGAADQDVVFRNPRHLRPHSVAQDAGKSDHVDADDSHGDLAPAKDDRPHAEIAPLVVHGARPPDASGDRQQRIGRDHASPRPHFDFCLRRRNDEKRTDKKDSQHQKSKTDRSNHGTPRFWN